MSAKPLTDTESAKVLRCLDGRKALALAVSGGADSMALMHLVRRWRQMKTSSAPDLVVLSVDHGLRPEAHDETKWVEAQARKLGLDCYTLRLDLGDRQTRVQEIARQARYDAMASKAFELGLEAIVTAHHLDDQAETVLMRLARGSGPDGLAGIPECGQWGGLPLLRPLLDVPKARLVATLEANQIKWLEDPSNDDSQFERVRIRKGLGDLEQLGIDATGLARTAMRLRRACEALDETARTFLASHAQVNDAGFCRIDADAFKDAPEDIAVRALSHALQGVGGRYEPPRLAKLEKLVSGLRCDGVEAATLSRCLIRLDGEHITVTREGGARRGPAALELHPGTSQLWDGRYRVSLDARFERPVEVRALGSQACRLLEKELERPFGLPKSAAAGLASFWLDDELLAVPPVGYAGQQPEDQFRADFVNAGLFQAIR